MVPEAAWVRVGDGSWEQARLELSGPVLLVHRATGTLVLPFASVEQVEEADPGPDGWPVVELFQFGGSNYWIKLSRTWLDGLLAAMWSARAAAVPSPLPQTAPTAAYLPAGPGYPPAPHLTIKPHRKFPKLAVAAIVAGVLVVGGVVINAATSAGPHEVVGTYLLMDESEEVLGSFYDCEGSGGYGDFAAGADVTVYDGDGNEVGSTVLENVSSETEAQEYLEATAGEDGAEIADTVVNDDYTYCLLVFDVTVEDAEEYSIEIGDGHRGSQDYDRSDLVESDWTVAITLGFS